MKPYIYGVRNGIHIIDLSKTVRQLQEAMDFLADAVGDGADVLFVGTKKQSQEIIEEAARSCKMYYINQRWLGGTLTNWKTIKSSIERLKTLEQKKNDGTFSVLAKKEILLIDREIDKLEHSLGGIKEMNRPPAIMIIIDPNQERIALHEANVLHIPVVALADTNCDPDPIDYPVVGNDDAIRSIKLFLDMACERILEGLQLREVRVRKAAEDERGKPGDDKPVVREMEMGGKKAGAYVATRENPEVEEAQSGSYSAKVEPESTAVVLDEDLEGETAVEAAPESAAEPAAETAEAEEPAAAPEETEK